MTVKIRQGMQRKFRKWRNKMRAAGKQAILDNLCKMSVYVEEDKDNPLVAAAELWQRPRPYRLGQISDEGLYEVFLAFSVFHKQGKDFRMKWNAALSGSEGYAKYIEEGRKKYMFNPLRKSSSQEGEGRRNADGNWE